MYQMPGASIIPYNNKLPELGSGVFVASGAILIGDLKVGVDSSFWFNTVVRADCNYITIGAQTNVQDGSVIHVTRQLHPTIIGDRVSIGHNVTLHGCRIGNGCLIGTGAIVLDGTVIGENCFVAAGSLVTPHKTFEPNSMIMGSPARRTRPLTKKEQDILQQTPKNYLTYKSSYLAP